MGLESKGWMEGSQRLFQWVFDLVYLNLLWLVFTFLGAGVLGIAPATFAVFAVLRQLLRKEEQEVPLGKTFAQYYRGDFWRTNGLFYLLVLVGVLLTSNLLFLSGREGTFSAVLLYLTAFLGVFYLIVWVFVFPVFVHFNMVWYQCLKYALLFGMSRPLQLLLILSLLAIAYGFLASVPLLLVFFGSSLWAFIIMGVSWQMFKEIDVPDN